MRSSSAVLLLAMTLSACSTPNRIPLWNIDIVPSASSDIDQAAAAAQQIGFVPKDVPQTSESFGVDKTATVLRVWYWPALPSTSAGFFKDDETGDNFLLFGDSQTEGQEIIGRSCTKYLEFVQALKTRFGAARLKFYKETCDPGSRR